MVVNQEIVRQFFATKERKPITVKIGGQFKFDNLPNQVQIQIKERLAEKDPVVKDISERKAVGIIIDGKEVTQQWADELDLTKPNIPRSDGVDINKLIKAREESLKISAKETISEKPKEESKATPTEVKPTKKELETKLTELGFKKFRDWAKKTYDVTGISGNEIIRDILKKVK